MKNYEQVLELREVFADILGSGHQVVKILDVVLETKKPVAKVYSDSSADLGGGFMAGEQAPLTASEQLEFNKYCESLPPELSYEQKLNSFRFSKKRN